ncbi:MAG TPA: hypothetical protein VF701_00675 [Thermoanaerobaculia bacterium]
MRLFRRDSVSLLVVWAFVTATTVIPALHLVFHSRPHSHSVSGIHYHDAAGEPSSAHRHAAHSHSHPPSGADHQHPHTKPSELPEVPESDHGTGSAAHFALALSDGPASFEPILAVAFQKAGRLAASHATRPHSRDCGTLHLRGPPATT